MFKKSNAASLLMFVPLSVAAQETPKLELFGGYSYLGLTEQSRTLLKAASLNGWSASVKLNVTPRVGFLADFSGNYGQRGLTPYTINSLTTSGELMRVEAAPGDMRPDTFLFGPELRLLGRNRLSVNVRALMGVAHTNTLVLPLRKPIQRSTGSPITERTFPSASTFAAAFGGSLDYRITDRLSYRIVQPELLLTRMGSAASENWNQYNFRLSTGVVFTSGESSFGQSSERHFSVGVIGGAALTDAFGHESTGFIIGPNGGIQPTLSRSYSTVKDYAIGPTLEVGLPWRDLAVEIDALYRPMNLTMAGVNPDGSLNSISPATVVTWELPTLAKYRFGSRSVKPFIEVGPSFRFSGNPNGASPSVYGGTAGIGIETHFRKLRIGPVVRYTLARLIPTSLLHGRSATKSNCWWDCRSDGRLRRWAQDRPRTNTPIGCNRRETPSTNVSGCQIRISSAAPSADHCGVHGTFMGTIERGESNLSFSNLVKVAEGLGITLAQLLSGLEKKAAQSAKERSSRT